MIVEAIRKWRAASVAEAFDKKEKIITDLVCEKGHHHGHEHEHRHRGGRGQGGGLSRGRRQDSAATSGFRPLTGAEIGKTYIIRGINTDERAMRDFLFTLGCYEGVEVTIISSLARNYIITVKDSRYSIDEDLARAILI